MKSNQPNQMSRSRGGRSRWVTAALCLSLVAGLCRADAPAGTDPNRPHDTENDLLLAKNPTTDAERQVWKARIGSSGRQPTPSQREELKLLLEQVRAMEFDTPRAVPAEPEPAAAPNAEPEPAGTTPVPAEVPSEAGAADPTNPSGPAAPAAIAVAPPARLDTALPPDASPSEPEPAARKVPDGYITAETLAIVRQRLAQSEPLENPLKLAEILFRSECLPEAAQCYQMALDQRDAAAEDPYGDRAWILFQLGNCLQKTDPSEALEHFSAVLARYPDSAWAEAAKAKSRLIDWYLKDKPVALMSAGQPAEVRDIKGGTIQ